jgi:hypothetical protein
MALRKNTSKYSTASTPKATNTSTNKTTNTSTAKTANTTTGTPKSSTVSSGNNRQHITNSPTVVVSTNTQSAPTVKVESKPILSGLFGQPTVKNAPYAETQKSQHLINSQSQISKSEQSVNKAQNKNFTYAQDKAGNTYTITSQLSLQQRQDLAKQGISTSGIPYVNVGFASQTIDVNEAAAILFKNDITVDEKLANQQYLYYDLSETQGMEQIDTVDTVEDGFTANQATEATEQSAASNDVQLGANTFGSDGATTETADVRYNDGSTLTTQKDDPLIVEMLAGQKSTEQWMNQVNEQIVALGNYHAFSNNGKNGGNGVYSNGNGQLKNNGKTNGMANIEATFAKITGSKYFPIVIVGFIVLLVIGFLKPKAAAAAPSAPSKVFQFA